MCGICGIFSISGKQIKKVDVCSMLNNMVFRGPDDEGMWGNCHVALGSRRLIIRDKEGGRQPMFSADGNIVVVYNGEIYNADEIRKKLGEKYHFRSSHSDTEVLLHTYAEYGEECSQHLNGMFSFALYDARLNQIILARDRLGIKPLFYYQENDSVYFSSDYIALLEIKKWKKLNKNVFNAVFMTRHNIGEETIIEGIYSVPPGYFLKINPQQGITLKQYWQLVYNVDFSIDEYSCTQKLRDLLDQSVKKQLVADVPLGVFLSGGLDSSTVTAFGGKYLKNLKTYSIGFVDSDQNEFDYAQQVADYINTDHINSIQKIDRLIKDFDLWLRYLGQPIAARDSYPLFLIAERAKKDITVVLTGTGADEILNGYNSVLFEYLDAHINPLKTKEEKYKEYVIKFGISDKYGLERVADEQYFLKFVNPTWLDFSYPIQETEKIVKEFETNTNHPELYQNEIDYFHIKNHLVHGELVLADTMTMAHSLEARVPLLDHDLVEFVATIPPQLKKDKYIMKKAIANALPKGIVERKKVGFSRTFVSAFTNVFYKLVENFEFRDRGIFNVTGIEQAKQEKNFEIVWRAYILERWMQLFLD